MKKHLTLPFLILVLLLGSYLPAFSQIDFRTYHEGSYQSLDTVYLNIDLNDNSGTTGGEKDIFFKIYNMSQLQSESFYVEAEFLCSNSDAYYQFCQQYPPDYTTGTCHVYHARGDRKYADYNYTIPTTAVTYNYLQGYIKVFGYSTEPEYEKVCRFQVKRRNTEEVLDAMVLVIRRGNMPCMTHATGIHTPSVEDVAEIYPNPASRYITIAARQNQLSACSLYSPDGKTMLTRTINNGARFDINLEQLANGVYYLKLTDKQGVSFYKKIVVDH